MKKHINFSLKPFIFAIFTGLITLVFTATAYATFVTPKKLIIDNNQRTAILTVLNRSDIPMAYQFEWERRTATAKGDMLLLKEGETAPDYQPADDLLKFSPRRFILKPNESQKIRILVRRPQDMSAGEYRSNLLIQTREIKAEEEDKSNQPIGGFSGRIKVRTNLSIPVFVLEGETKLDFTAHKPSIFKKDGQDHIRIIIDNNSTRSVYIKPVLECTKGGSVTISKPLPTIRLYKQIKTFTKEPAIPKDFSTSGCSSLRLLLSALDDTEYKRKLISSVDIR